MKLFRIWLCVFALGGHAYAQSPVPAASLGAAGVPGVSDGVVTVQGVIAKLMNLCVVQQFTTNYIDPYCSYNAAGVLTTTTGTIANGSNSLVVGSATGWSVGMGISVGNANTGGTTELTTYITAISGTTFTLNSNAGSAGCASTCTVYHDDTRAISAAITASMSSQQPIHLRSGNYNVTSALTTFTSSVSTNVVSVGVSFYGDGMLSTNIWNRGKTNNVFVLDSAASITLIHTIMNLAIRQDATITPTAGFGISIASTTAHYINPNIQNIMTYGLWGSLSIGPKITIGIIGNNTFYAGVGLVAILYDSPVPAGDNWIFNTNVINGVGGIKIVHADTTTWSNIKVTPDTASAPAGLLFAAGSASDISRSRFMNVGLEGPSGAPWTCGIDFGSNGANEISFLGVEIGGTTTPICNTAAVTFGLSIKNLQIAGPTFSALGIYDYLPAGTTVGNLPTCGTNTQNMAAVVTDAAASPVYGAAPTGGGTLRWPVFCSFNGVSTYTWTYH